MRKPDSEPTDRLTSPEAVTEAPPHIPVLAAEVIHALGPRPGETYVDCTAGFGGHAVAVAGMIGGGGRVVLNDADEGNLAAAAARVRGLGAGPEVVAVHGNFADLPRRMREMGLRADMVLADLGFASNQVDRAERGFSFMRDGPLDMRMNVAGGMTAAEFLAGVDEEELVRVLREYGEEFAARRIARKLVQVRQSTPIKTTAQFAELVREVLEGKARSGGRGGGIHPATRSFQAIRIAVNDELGSLEALLAAIGEECRAHARRGSGVGGGEGWLRPGARVGVISFHSLEDRPVKRAFGELVKAGWAEDVTGGVVTASEREIGTNPRSRSAKLRVIRLREGWGSGGSGSAGEAEFGR